MPDLLDSGYVDPDALAQQQQAAALAAAPPVQPGPIAAPPPPPVAAPPAAPAGPPPGAVGYTPSAGAPGAPGAAPPGQVIAIPGPVSAAPVKAGFIPATKSAEVQSGVDYSPDTKAAVDDFTKAGHAQLDAQRDLMIAQAAKNEIGQKLQSQLAEQQQREADQLQSNQEGARRQAWGALQKANAAAELARDKGVDPGHYSKTLGTGGKIATMLSLIAGGFNAGVHGGPNQALQALQQSIHDDIDSQKENIAGKERTAGAAGNYYGLLRANGLDESQALVGHHLVEMQNLQKAIDAKFPEATATGKLTLTQMTSQLSKDIAQLRAQFDEKATNKVTTKEEDKFRPASAGGDNFAKVRDYAAGLLKADHEAGGTMTPQQALGQAVQVYRSTRASTDQPEQIQKGKGLATAGARALVPKIAEGMSNLDILKRIRSLADQTFRSPSEQDEMNSLIDSAQKSGVTGLDRDAGMIGSIFGRPQAAVDAATRAEQSRIETARKVLKEGPGGPEPEPPSSFEEQ